jgi:hypothetical protein
MQGHAFKLVVQSRLGFGMRRPSVVVMVGCGDVCGGLSDEGLSGYCEQLLCVCGEARCRGPRLRRGRSWPEAAVRTVPARLLLLCLLFRGSRLTVVGDRHVGAAGVLHRRGRRAAVAVRVGVAGAFQRSSVPSPIGLNRDGCR